MSLGVSFILDCITGFNGLYGDNLRIFIYFDRDVVFINKFDKSIQLNI